jgi:hypothetical protein
MNPLGILFYNLSKELEMHFGIRWIKVKEEDPTILSGYGFYRRRDTNLWVEDFLELRISLNPKKYEIGCSNESLCASICSVFKMIDFHRYQLYVEYFKELIPKTEFDIKR